MGAFVEANLPDLFEFIRNGMSVKQSKECDGLPVTRIETISNGEIDANRFGYAGLNKSENAKWLLKRGDILFSHINSVEHIGKCALFDMDMDVIHGMNLLCFRPNFDRADPRYIKWLFRSPEFRSLIMPFVNKAVNQASISIGNLNNIRIKVPPLEEQKRIAAILDQADDIRRKRQHAIERLNQLGQAIFHDMFGDLDANNHNFPIVALDKLIKVQGGYAFKSDLFGEDGDPVIRISNIDGESVDLEKSVKIAPENVGKGRSFTISEGDLLIAMSGATTGKTGTVPKFSGTAYLNQRVGKYIILDNKNISANFLVNLVKSEFYQKRILDQAWGAAQPNVSSNQLVSFAIPLPPICIQNRFSECMNGLSDVKSANYAELERSTSLFASLQHRAFTGQL